MMFLKPLPVKGKIRIGPNEDGGYVVYEGCLKETDLLFTYGVGWNMHFEKHFNALTGKESLMFDPTMLHIFILDFKVVSKLLFSFKFQELYEYQKPIFAWWAKFLATRKNRYHFFNEGIALKKSEKYDSFSHHLDRFNARNKQIMLKIDIEENEYPILLDDEIYKNLSNVNQIVIEFHKLPARLSDLEKIMSRLTGEFYLVHIHGNNYGSLPAFGKTEAGEFLFPETIEVTLVRKSKLNPEDILLEDIEYPQVGLDYPNNPYKEDYKLNFDL